MSDQIHGRIMCAADPTSKTCQYVGFVRLDVFSCFFLEPFLARIACTFSLLPVSFLLVPLCISYLIIGLYIMLCLLLSVFVICVS